MYTYSTLIYIFKFLFKKRKIFPGYFAATVLVTILKWNCILCFDSGKEKDKLIFGVET